MKYKYNPKNIASELDRLEDEIKVFRKENEVLKEGMRDVEKQAKQAIELGATGVGYWEDLLETASVVLKRVEKK